MINPPVRAGWNPESRIVTACLNSNPQAGLSPAPAGSYCPYSYGIYFHVFDALKRHMFSFAKKTTPRICGGFGV